MSLAITVLKPVARIAGYHALAQTKKFFAAHDNTAQVQADLLAEMIDRHRHTAFGRDHGFSAIRNYEDFKAAVPVGNYETLRPYVDRVFNGETTALLPADERVLMFSQTSGTTGKPKNIPVTGRFLKQMRRGFNIFGLRALRDHPSGWMRHILTIASPMLESLSPTGLPCGAISGLLAATQMTVVRRMYAVPLSVSSIVDPEARYYTTLRCGVGKDVAIISTANPSSTIKMIETGQAHAARLIRDIADGTCLPPGDGGTKQIGHMKFRANRRLAARMEAGLRQDGELLPKHFWDLSFMTNWTGGTLKLYLPRLSELFGDVPVRDIGLLASEGRFSLPLADNTPSGVAEIMGNFLEFIPAEHAGADNPPTLRAEQLEIGQEYFLVITNWAGLWRYNIDDRIRVTDKLGDSPVFEFLSRGGHTASITGEKITEHQVVEAMSLACGEGFRPERFVLQGRFGKRPYYELRLDATDGMDIERLAGRMDSRLRELNMEYDSKRKTDRLGSIVAIAMPEGHLARAEREKILSRGGRSEQYKHQYLITDVLSE